MALRGIISPGELSSVSLVAINLNASPKHLKQIFLVPSILWGAEYWVIIALHDYTPICFGKRTGSSGYLTDH